MQSGISGNPRILSLLGCYWPGNEASGPNQSFRAFVSGLKDTFDIRVVSRDEPGCAAPGWHHDGTVMLQQLPIGPFGARGLHRLLRETPHDLLLLNGFQDREFTIPTLVMRRLGLVTRKPTILSPRGEFAKSARSLKPGRKRAYLAAVQKFGLLDDIWLHSTANHERQDIDNFDLHCKGVLEAPNAQLLADLPQIPARTNEQSSQLRLAFLGRITPVKNILFALEVLARLQIPVKFDIFGPIVDPNYWAECTSKIAQLPSHIQARSMGTLSHADVVSTLSRYDLFFLPTMGENFGHAIAEALSAGLPLLIADTTPWRGLNESGAGWDLPLHNVDSFVAAINAYASKPEAERLTMHNSARRLAEQSYANSNAIAANKDMLLHVLRMAGS